MAAVSAPRRTVAPASSSISENKALIACGSRSSSRVKRLRTTSKAIGASKKPTADPTPASRGMMTRPMPSLRATAIACSGAPPPKAIKVRSVTSSPFSTAWTRAALAMFSSTISITACAPPAGSVFNASPTAVWSACCAAVVFSGMRPPANPSASSLPSTRLASVTAAPSPPRP